MKRRVLVVEDDMLTCNCYVRVLGRVRREVTVVHTLKEAAELCAPARWTENPFGTVILDWALPDGIGLEVAQMTPHLVPRPQVLVVSGVVDAEVQLEAKRLGAVFVSKPFTGEQLCAMIDLIESQRFEPIRLYGERYGFSERQVQVLAHSLDGLTVLQVASRMGCGEESVKTHWKRICERTGMSTRALVLQDLLRFVRANIH